MVLSATFLSDTIKFIRNDLDSGVTDPISAIRSGRDRFVMTSYPTRPVKYPIITVKDIGVSAPERMGMQSEISLIRLSIEVRVWARNVKEKDELAEQVFNRLRQNQYDGASPSTDAELHDFRLNSMVNVDEPGEAGIKSKVMEYEYIFLTE